MGARGDAGSASPESRCRRSTSSPRRSTRRTRSRWRRRGGRSTSSGRRIRRGRARDRRPASPGRASCWRSSSSPSLRRVLNATGVIVHTNLGRAPLPAAARDAVARAAEGYSNLELDLDTGERGSRARPRRAAAVRADRRARRRSSSTTAPRRVLLAAAALAGPRPGDRRLPRPAGRDRRRLPDPGGDRPVGRAAGRGRDDQPHAARRLRARARGRTTTSARSCACTRRTSARSGSSRTSRSRRCASSGVPVIDDVGSGWCSPTRTGSLRSADEPPLKRSVAAGAALVCCSGDKLLGGPQAGLIVGRRGRGRRRAPASAGAGAADRQAVAGRARGDAEAVPRPRARARRDPGAGDARRPTSATLAARAAAARGGDRRPRREVIRATAQGRRRRAAAARARGPGGRARRHASPTRSLGRSAPPIRRVIARIHDGRVLLDPRTLTDDEVEPLRGRARAARWLTRMTAAPLTLGTAGHIDHGKTALIRALTGVDTDRLPEERARGISIELGYASLDAAIGPAPVGDRRARPRAVRAHDGRRRDRDRPVPDDDRRRRRRDAADARARRGAARARRRRRRRRGDQVATSPTPRWRCSRPPSCSRAPRSWPSRRAPARASTSCAQRSTGPAPQLASRADAAARGAAAHRSRVHDPRARARSSPGRCGRARSAAATSSSCSRGAGGSACAASRSTTSRSSRAPAGPARGGQPDRHRGRTRSRAATCSSAPTPSCGRRYLIDAELEFGDARARARRPRPGPPRHARGAGAARLARRPLLAAPPRAAADRRRGDRLVVRQIAPPDTLGGGRVLDPHPRKHGPSRELLRPARAAGPRRGARHRRTGAARPPADAGGAGPQSRLQRAAVHRRALGARAAPARGRARAAARLRARRRTTSPRCATPAARSGSSKTLHYHADALARDPRAAWSRSRSGTAARSRSPSCATSSAPRASSPRRCSSTSTPSGDDPPRRRARPAPAAPAEL